MSFGEYSEIPEVKYVVKEQIVMRSWSISVIPPARARALLRMPPGLSGSRL